MDPHHDKGERRGGKVHVLVCESDVQGASCMPPVPEVTWKDSVSKYSSMLEGEVAFWIIVARFFRPGRHIACESHYLVVCRSHCVSRCTSKDVSNEVGVEPQLE